MKTQNNTRRAVSVLLCVLLLCSLIPPVFAVDGSGSITGAEMAIGSKEAQVSYHATVNAIAVAALYDAESGKMHTVGTADTDPGSSSVTVALPEARQEGDELRVFLLDRNSSAPLAPNWPDSGEDEHTVIFWCNDGTDAIADVVLVPDGETVAAPQDPTSESWQFTGWYEEKAAINLFDFSAPIEHDTYLYAGWGDGSGELSAVYDEKETENAITEVEMRGSEVAVTVNANQSALITVEFLKDTYGQENAEEELIDSVSVQTPDFCEQEVLLAQVDFELPQYYLIRVTMTDGGGNELCNPLQCIDYTSVYAEYEAKTTEDFDQDRVVNFDESEEDNFGVLSDQVKIMSDTAEMTYEEIYDENGYLEEERFTGEYMVKNPSEDTLSLQSGDIVLFYNGEGLPLMFTVASVTVDEDGNAVITKGDDPEMTDAYEFLKVDMWTAADEEDSASLMAEVVDVDETYMNLNLGPNIDYRPKGKAFHIKTSGTIGIKGSLKMLWDAHLFKEDYFEMSHKLVTTTSVDVEAKVDNDFSKDEKSPNHNERLSIPIMKQIIPTEVPLLMVELEVNVPVELAISGGAGVHYENKTTSGFTYNTDTGAKKIQEKEQEVKLTLLEGEIELKFGPKVSLSLAFTGDLMKASATAQAGVTLTASDKMSTQVETADTESVHACKLCRELELKWFIESKAKVTLNVPKVKKLQCTLLDLTIFKLEGPISFYGIFKDGKAYWSILNGTDSVFHGKNSGIHAGTCPNIRYRTTFETQDKDGKAVRDVAVSVKRQDGKEMGGKNAPCCVFLYPGVYTASATVDGKQLACTFIVDESAQTVTISPKTADASVVGTVRDAATGNVLSGVVVTASQNGDTVIGAKTDNNGRYLITGLAPGKADLSFKKDGYSTGKLQLTLAGGQQATGDISLSGGSTSGIPGNVKVGSYVTFGHYEQDNDLTNGKESIRWRVLAVENGRALLISKYALDCKPYNETYTNVTWETCTLRQWLNHDFYNAAFAPGEQAAIATTTVTAEDNPYYGTEAGNNTQDKIFLLSIGEAEQYFVNDDGSHDRWKDSHDRACKPTEYAVAQDCGASSSSAWYGGFCWWWLRSPGDSQDLASRVDDDGSVGGNGDDVSFDYDGVRPAFWINLSS